MKDISKNRWAVVELAFCDEGLSYEEAGVLHYIAKFEKRKGPVYAGLSRIAQDTRISERSVQRHIRKLIRLNFLHEKTTGRSRYLTANHAKMASIVAASLAVTHAKMEGNDAKMASIHAKMAPDPCQNGMLHIEVPIDLTYRKKPIDSVPSKNGKQVGEDETMAERKAGQANREWWSALADSEKKDLLAQVEAFGTIFDKKLCKPDTDIGLAILRRYATQPHEDVIKQPQDAQG
jgi:hypothetical protein